MASPGNKGQIAKDQKVNQRCESYNVSQLYQKLLKERGANYLKPNESYSRKRSNSSSDLSIKDNDTVGTSDNNFTYPKKAIKVRKTSSNGNIPLQNKFASFANPELIDDVESMDGCESEPALLESTPKKTQVQQKFSNIRNSVNGSNSTTKSQKPTPIFLSGLDIKQLINNLVTSGIPKNLFAVKKNDDTFIVKADNLKTHDDIKKYFSSNNVEFYTFTPRSQKPINLVLKGIEGKYDADDISNEIKSLNLNNVEIKKITQIKFSNKNNKLNFLVQLSSNSSISEIKKVNHLICQKITWEHLRKNKVYQCKNCQLVGHTSSNCNISYRCVKCENNHKPGECSITERVDKSILYCVNCKEKGHPANFKGCPFMLFAQHLFDYNKQKIQSNRKSKFNKISREVSNHLSYSNAFKNQYHQQFPTFTNSNITNTQTTANNNNDTKM